MGPSPELRNGFDMFSDHLPKIDSLPRLAIVVGAGAAILLGGLMSMVGVVDQQMERAALRELQRLERQAALTECMERNTGPMRHGCIQQVQAALDTSRQAMEAARKADPAEGAVVEAALDRRSIASADPVAATR